MTTWYLCKQDDEYKMVQADSVEDLEWMLPFSTGKESVVETFETDKDLVRTENTVFGDQCTERCPETFLTDFEAITSIDWHIDAKKLWDTVTKGEVFYDENEDIDYPSGDTSTHHFYFGCVDGLELDECDDYPRRDEGDELSDEELHDRFDESLNDIQDEIEIAGITLSPSYVLKHCNKAAYNTAFRDWLDDALSDEVYVERDGRYFEKI